MIKENRRVILYAIAMLLMILDAKTVIQGAMDGVKLAVNTIIPSLFPFFIISAMLNANLLGLQIPGLGFLSKLCGIPQGVESIFLLGLLGGYPVGAKCIDTCFRSGYLSRDCARRMLGFCSNCGPAFIFGLCGFVFQSRIIPWLLWLTQILSAVVTGILLPRSDVRPVQMQNNSSLSVVTAVSGSIRTTGEICGWIVVFRAMTSLVSKWLLWFLPQQIQVGILGCLEIANGCCSLAEISSMALRYILCGCFICFGGICVIMQTFSVTGATGIGLYLPGKLIQLGISMTVSTILAILLFQQDYQRSLLLFPFIGILLLCCTKYRLNRKKVIALV